MALHPFPTLKEIAAAFYHSNRRPRVLVSND